MNYQRQDIRSTKPKKPTLESQYVDAAQKVWKKERDVYSKIVDLWDMKGTIYTDQIGMFQSRQEVVQYTSLLWLQLTAILY